jgi:hypothetical protein
MKIVTCRVKYCVEKVSYHTIHNLRPTTNSKKTLPFRPPKKILFTIPYKPFFQKYQKASSGRLFPRRYVPAPRWGNCIDLGNIVSGRNSRQPNCLSVLNSWGRPCQSASPPPPPLRPHSRVNHSDNRAGTAETPSGGTRYHFILAAETLISHPCCRFHKQ